MTRLTLFVCLVLLIAPCAAQAQNRPARGWMIRAKKPVPVQSPMPIPVRLKEIHCQKGVGTICARKTKGGD